jgi:hypothetical protein
LAVKHTLDWMFWIQDNITFWNGTFSSYGYCILPCVCMNLSHFSSILICWKPLLISLLAPNLNCRPTELKWPHQTVQMFQMKMTSNGRWPQNIISGIYQQPLVGPYLNLKLKLMWANTILRMLQIKLNCNRRQPQNIKSGISQQPLVGSYPNFKL